MTPHQSATAGKQLLLASLLHTIDGLSAEIEHIEAQMADLLADTQGAVLTQVRGIGVVAASGVTEFIGHTDRWQRWSQVWRAAGLDPARSQSGPRDNAYGISREGAAWGRRAILDLTASVVRQPGPRRDRYLATRDAGRPSGIAITAEANKLGRMCFALMATGGGVGPVFVHVDFGEMGATVDGVITTPDGRRPPGSKTVRATPSPCRWPTDAAGLAGRSSATTSSSPGPTAR